MLPSSLLVLAASFVAPIIAASTPNCVAGSDATGYAAQKLPYLYNEFCDGLSTANFANKEKFYDSPVISLKFSVASVAECSLAQCLSGFKTLVEGCDKDNKSIWGTGTLDTSCGSFSFTVWSPTATASLGTPDATITVATMKTYDIASLTATSSSSSAVSTTSEAQLSSTTYAASTYFANSTSSTTSSNSSTSYASATLITSSASTSQSATSTKPFVGSTTLGSGADVMRVSGLSLVAVACVFSVFM